MLLHALFMTALTGFAPSAQTVTHPPTTSSAIARIEMIDETARTVTLHFDDDTTDTFTVSPDVKRFHELKVGQRIRFRYYESVAYTLRKAGSTEQEPGRTDKGHIVTRRVKDKNRLTGVEPGDRIDIVHTEALLVNVLPES